MSKTAFANDDLTRREVVQEEIARQNYLKRHEDAWSGGTTDLSSAKPFSAATLRLNVNEALAECLAAGIEVVSATPERVELRIPCDLGAMSPLEKLLAYLDADLPKQIGEAISYACREMLTNAVEYGCPLDHAARVEFKLCA